MSTELKQLKLQNKAPEWLTENGYKTLKGGYLLEGETPYDMMYRVAKASATNLKNINPLIQEDYTNYFFNIIWKGWLGLSTPVSANMGTDRALPISCFGSVTHDSIQGITTTNTEVSVMSALGGGTSVFLGDIRPEGTTFGKDSKGISGGVVPWIKILDSIIIAISQSSLRRGALAVYLPVEHPDLESFLRIRLGEGDTNRQCMNVHQGVTISNSFMEKVEIGDTKALTIWKKLMKARADTGEPYLIFIDSANEQSPKWLKNNNLEIKASNLCFLEDEYIATKTGLVQIKDLEGKVVEIYDGEAWVNNANFRKIGTETNFVKVTLHSGQELITTLDHKYPLVNGNFVKAKDLIKGQKLEMSFNGKTQVHGNIKASAAYLKGFLISDNSSFKGMNKPILWSYESKHKCEKRLLDSLDQLELKSLSKSDTLSTVEFVQLDEKRKILKGLTRYTDSLYLWCTGAKERIPKEVFIWDKESKLDFLAGLFDGSPTLRSSISESNLSVDCLHKSFLLDLQKLLGTFGVNSLVSLAKTNNLNKGYRLTLTDTDISTLVSYGLVFSDLENYNLVSERSSETERNLIKSVEFITFDQPKDVYCTKVESTSKFMISNNLMSGNCSEIFLPSDYDHSFVCCLSSMNLDKYDEWKDTNTVEIATYFLDGVMQEFINKTKDLYGMQRAYNFAVKSRALGLGVLGYHSLLQRKGIAFESEEARMLNEEIFKKINTASFSASQTLADLYGEPEWCEGYEVRNLTRLAIAPTVSNSMICGEVSPGVEPWDSNYFVKGSAKGDLIQRNLYLDKLLDSKGLSLTEKEAVWKSILSARGSVQHLECLTTVEKQVYKTAREINQMEIVKQAGTRQKYIDQGQSINLFFDDPTKVDPNYFSKVHFAAYKLGLKSLYYCRSAAKLKSSVTQPADLSIKKSKEFKIQEEEVKDFCRINSEQTGESCSACEG